MRAVKSLYQRAFFFFLISAECMGAYFPSLSIFLVRTMADNNHLGISEFCRERSARLQGLLLKKYLHFVVPGPAMNELTLGSSNANSTLTFDFSWQCMFSARIRSVTLSYFQRPELKENNRTQPKQLTYEVLAQDDQPIQC